MISLQKKGFQITYFGSLFSNVYLDYIIRELLYTGGTKKIISIFNFVWGWQNNLWRCRKKIIRKLLYGGDTRKIKKYFHILYGVTEEPMEMQEENNPKATLWGCHKKDKKGIFTFCLGWQKNLWRCRKKQSFFLHVFFFFMHLHVNDNFSFFLLIPSFLFLLFIHSKL